jgi:PPOX class probable F420-dependent enzyme
MTTTPLNADDQARLAKFLEPTRIAVVATIYRSGVPHLTPNWFVYEGGRIAISTTKERVKYRNLSRDPRMSVCIFSELTAADYVTVSGPVTISDDESIWPVTGRIVERYVPTAHVEERMALLRTQSRVILSLAPESVVFRG